MSLDESSVFVKVVQLGSFSEAARQLRMPKSTVSKRIAQLEQRLGVTLLKRTTREIRVTEAGRSYFETCRRVLEDLIAAEAALARIEEKPRGLLKISAGPEGTGAIGDLITRFLLAHEEVEVDLQVTTRVADLVGDEVDVAIRVGPLKNSTLRARLLGNVVFKFFASPAYLEHRPVPRRPTDLEQHDCLCLEPSPCLAASRSRPQERWFELRNGSERVRFRVRCRFSSNQVSAVHHQVVAGRGIGFLPAVSCAADVREGALVPLLSHWGSPGIPVHLVHAAQPFTPPKVRAFVDFATRVLEPDAWEAESHRAVRSIPHHSSPGYTGQHERDER